MPDFVAPQLTEKSLQETRRAVGCGDLYVFGYGSLMWRPGFRFIECSVARIYGYHRRLAVCSWHYRGTPQKPGLVFGLDKGALATACCIAWQQKTKEESCAICFAEKCSPMFICRVLLPPVRKTGRAHNGLWFLLSAVIHRIMHRPCPMIKRAVLFVGDGHERF